MTAIFVSYAQEDATCAELILKSLEARGYSVWREPKTLQLSDVLYPRTIENVILGSAAVVLVWSSNAAHSEWVERHILFAQRLKKPIFPILLDGTDLPNTLVMATSLTSQAPCTDLAPQLVPLLPQPGTTDPLVKVSEQAAHEFIRIRKEAVDQAAEMLKRDEQREAVLAILDYLAHNDLMMGVRDKSQAVLDADAKKDVPSLPPNQSRHIFGVKCRNGHVTYFDKRRVCPASSMVVRDIVERAGKKLDALYLKCEQCDEEMVVHVDCEGYK
jgi:hypothetical protein